MKSMIFIAPPAAGKGTQAKIICDEYNLEHISTGDLLRASEDPEIKEKMALGEFISDDIILDLIKKEISSLESYDGYVLDGFPRNLNQAVMFDDMLENLNLKIDNVIYIDVDKEVAKNRVTGRLYCSNCGATYSEYVKDNMPQVTGVCDRCHNSLIKREDDNVKTFETRFDNYINLTLPLLDYYKDKGILSSVDGNCESSEVSASIKEIINN